MRPPTRIKSRRDPKNEEVGLAAKAFARIHADRLLRRALPAARFVRNAAIPVTDLVH